MGNCLPSPAHVQVKMHWVHTKYWKMGPEGNDIQKTNVPALRMRFRSAGGWCYRASAGQGLVWHCAAGYCWAGTLPLVPCTIPSLCACL